MAQLVTALIAVTLAAGCSRQLNRQYCEANPKDVDCRNAGYVGLDAPTGCVSNASCTDPLKPVCDTRTQQCEQCVLPNDTAACTGDTPQCGEDNACHGCIFDAHCASDVCLPDGKCALGTAVLYARPNGTGTCTQADPCTLTTAVQMLSTEKYIIKLTASNGTVYREPPIQFAVPFGVKVLAASTTFQPTADGDAITVSDGNVEIVGLAVTTPTGADARGLVCSNGARVTMSRMQVLNSVSYGLVSTGCNVTIERSRFTGNPSGAMLLTAGTLEIRNNIIAKNGNGSLERGNVTIRNAGGRIAFNTIVENNSKGGSDRVGGVDCIAGPGMRVARNIIAGNGGGDPIGGDCTVQGNYQSTSISGIGFGVDYKLTANTPLNTIRDDSASQADCIIVDKFISDFEGQPRPYVFCDRGADEYHP